MKAVVGDDQALSEKFVSLATGARDGSTWPASDAIDLRVADRPGLDPPGQRL